jgi:hypothetical protein
VRLSTACFLHVRPSMAVLVVSDLCYTHLGAARAEYADTTRIVRKQAALRPEDAISINSGLGPVSATA